jgi:hypothetical protein
MRKYWWHAQSAYPVIPAGIIFPFSGGVIPVGWSHFKTGRADAIKISDTDAGVIGGVTGLSVRSVAVGNHSGDAVAIWASTQTAGAGTGTDAPSTKSAGSHSHLVTIYYTPEKYQTTLIKADIEHKKIPAKAGIITDVDLSGDGLVNVTPSGLLSSSQNVSHGVVAASSGIGDSSANGNHTHETGETAPDPASNVWCYRNGYSSGTHNHTGNLHKIDADDIRRYHARLWEHASDDYRLRPGYFGLWESSIPPDGWSICDGKNGTPDLTDYFINFDASLVGTKTGDGTITVTGTLRNGGSHNHLSTSVIKPYGASGYHDNYNNDNHPVAPGPKGFEPLFYTLIMIKYTG